jgi:hypothetical protein
MITRKELFSQANCCQSDDSAALCCVMPALLVFRAFNSCQELYSYMGICQELYSLERTRGAAPVGPRSGEL